MHIPQWKTPVDNVEKSVESVDNPWDMGESEFEGVCIGSGKKCIDLIEILTKIIWKKNPIPEKMKG